MRGASLLLLVLVLAPLGLTAQTMVAAERDLDFGLVIRGVPSTISVYDPSQSGRIRVQGPPRGQIQVDFGVPNQLQGSAGASMPITIGKKDVGYSAGGSPNKFKLLDPRKRRKIKLDRTGELLFDFGGQVSPTTNQRPGGYASPIILTVSVL